MGKKSTASRKLAFVIHDLNTWGGQDRSTLEIARRLSRRWPVEVYAFSVNGAAPERLDHHKIWPDIAGPAIVRNTIFQAATLLRLGLGRHRPVVHATGTCSIVSDVVQVQFVHTAWRAATEAQGATGSAFRGLYHRLLLDHEARLEKVVYSRKKRYIAISDSVARDLSRHFGLVDGVRVIRHGVDATRFRPAVDAPEISARAALRAKHKIGPTDVMFVFVGAYARKGLDAALRAVAKLSAPAKARTRLVAVGSGDQAHYLGLASQLGVSESLSLVEHTRDVTPYYQAADAFLLPTLYEPFGLVILEAMACGLPCLVSASAGAAELMRDGDSGLLLTDPTDADEIGRKLESLVANATLRRQMGAAARKIAVARSWDQVAVEYEDFLSPMLEGDSR